MGKTVRLDGLSFILKEYIIHICLQMYKICRLFSCLPHSDGKNDNDALYWYPPKFKEDINLCN